MGNVVTWKRVAAAVCLAGVVVSGCAHQDEQNASDAPVTTTEPQGQDEATPGSSYVASAEDGEAQRSWPRKFFDDSAYRPGTWAATPQGVPVYTPQDPMGEVLGTPHDRNEVAECHPSSPRVPGKVRVEYIHGRFFVLSDSDGPGKVQKNGLFTDYAQSPVAAAMAAHNFLSYMIVSPDKFGKAAMRELTTEDPSEYLELESEEMLLPWMPPEAFQVQNCAGNMVTISVAFQTVVDEKGNPTTDPVWVATMFEMKWENGQWIVQESNQQNVYGNNPTIRSLDGWTRFKYQ